MCNLFLPSFKTHASDWLYSCWTDDQCESPRASFPAFVRELTCYVFRRVQSTGPGMETSCGPSNNSRRPWPVKYYVFYSAAPTYNYSFPPQIWRHPVISTQVCRLATSYLDYRTDECHSVDATGPFLDSYLRQTVGQIERALGQIAPSYAVPRDLAHSSQQRFEEELRVVSERLRQMAALALSSRSVQKRRAEEGSDIGRYVLLLPLSCFPCILIPYRSFLSCHLAPRRRTNASSCHQRLPSRITRLSPTTTTMWIKTSMGSLLPRR